MVGFQHNGRHVQFELTPEAKAKVIAAVQAIESALDMPADVAKLCWPLCLEPGDMTAEAFEAAIVADPLRGGVMLVGLLENVKISDDAERAKFQAMLGVANSAINKFRETK